MCELFGASLSKAYDLREYLKIFYSHSVRHPHGWGLMRFCNGQIQIIKEPVSAVESNIINDVIEQTLPQENLLAHIRLATVGKKKPENCHPYSAADNSGRKWTLIHNGTIYSGNKLMKYLNVQNGDTDSERIFLYLLDLVNYKISQCGELDEKQRFDIVDILAHNLSPRNKLNLMIFDGDVLYIHKNMHNTLSYKHTENGFLFSTEPLDNDWEGLPMCKVFAFKQGEKIFESESCTSEFVPTLEYLSALAAMNI
ncbi:MAG: class II glutamine amidotransferase [Acutalibacteraceae bacterium]